MLITSVHLHLLKKKEGGNEGKLLKLTGSRRVITQWGGKTAIDLSTEPTHTHTQVDPVSHSFHQRRMKIYEGI